MYLCAFYVSMCIYLCMLCMCAGSDGEAFVRRSGGGPAPARENLRLIQHAAGVCLQYVHACACVPVIAVYLVTVIT